MTNTTTLRLGQAVTYIDSNGHLKAALVVGTSDSVESGHEVQVPDEGHVHLAVFSPSGKRYNRFNVPEANEVFATQAFTA